MQRLKIKDLGEVFRRRRMLREIGMLLSLSPITPPPRTMSSCITGVGHDVWEHRRAPCCVVLPFAGMEITMGENRSIFLSFESPSDRERVYTQLQQLLANVTPSVRRQAST